MTVEEVKQEVNLLTLENIRHFPCTLSQKDDFYSMHNRFGVEAARTIMIPLIWNNKVPRPSEVLRVKR